MLSILDTVLFGRNARNFRMASSMSVPTTYHIEMPFSDCAHTTNTRAVVPSVSLTRHHFPAY